MAYQLISEPCSWFHTPGNLDKLTPIGEFTGLGVNKIGIYQSCIEEESYKYFMVRYHINQVNGTFISGVCYSANCTTNDLKYILQTFNEYIKAPAKIIDISEVGINTLQLSNWSIVLFVFIMLFVLAGLFCTLLNYVKKQWDKSSKLYTIVDLLSYRSSINVFFYHTRDFERNRVIVGIRGIAFLLMTSYNIGLVLLNHPSIGQSNVIHTFFAMTFHGFDMWFLASGFTLAMDLSKNWQKNHSIRSVFLIFLRLFIQIWLTSVFVLAWIKASLQHFGEGPLWHLAMNYLKVSCNLTPGYFFLFGNLIPSQCEYFLWVWDCTIQLSLVAVLLFLLKQSQLMCRNVLYCAVQGCIIGGAYLLAMLYQDEVNLKTGLIQGNVYKNPVVRGIAYFCGFNLGLFYFDFKGSRQKTQFVIVKIYKSRLSRAISALIGLAILFLIGYYYEFWFKHLTQTSQILISQALSSLICLSLILLCLPCLLGYLGFLRVLVSDHTLNYLSKLSFSAYSIEYMIILCVIYNRSEDLYLNFAKVMSIISSVLLLTVTIGFLFCIIFEMLIYRLIQKLMRGETKKFYQFF